MLVNSILCSSEVLYGIIKKHIDILEKCDRLFFSKLFSVPFSCSYEAYFLETNAIPLRFILLGRRLMYYWTILNKNDEELVKQVFILQKRHAVRDDWATEIQSNLNSLDITLSEEEIKQMTKVQFKNIINSKVKQKASEFLNCLRQEHSKTKHLNSYAFQRIALLQFTFILAQEFLISNPILKRSNYLLN